MAPAVRVAARSTLLALCLSLYVGPQGVQAIAACAACPPTMTCVLDTVATPLMPGKAALEVKVCNWDVAETTAFSWELSLKKPLACDPTGSLTPKITAVQPVAACSATSCVLHATLAGPMDWALATNGNTLMAKLKGAGASPDVVAIASSSATDSSSTGGVISALGDATSLSVCSTTIPVTGMRLSTMNACNAVVMCLGKASDKACTASQILDSAAGIDAVTCDADKCTGQVPLTKALPCEAASTTSNAMLLSVRVGNAAASAYTNLGAIAAAPKASILSVDNFTTGSSSLMLHTDALCPMSALQIQIDPLKIASITPATSNGTLALRLAGSISSAQTGQKLAISLSQCGVAAASFAAVVGHSKNVVDHSEIEAGATRSMTSEDLSSSAPAATDGGGAVTTQRNNASTGLHDGVYIAIGAAILALCGFLYECLRTRRSFHRAQAYRQAEEQMNVAAS